MRLLPTIRRGARCFDGLHGAVRREPRRAARSRARDLPGGPGRSGRDACAARLRPPGRASGRHRHRRSARSVRSERGGQRLLLCGPGAGERGDVRVGQPRQRDGSAQPSTGSSSRSPTTAPASTRRVWPGAPTSGTCATGSRPSEGSSRRPRRPGRARSCRAGCPPARWRFRERRAEARRLKVAKAGMAPGYCGGCDQLCCSFSASLRWRNAAAAAPIPASRTSRRPRRRRRPVRSRLRRRGTASGYARFRAAVA